MAVTLYKNKQDCCGCGACKNACPRNAISLIPDEEGYTYPRIDEQRCIECGACEKVCGYQKLPLKSTPKVCYAAAARDAELLERAASGGLFSVLATKMLQNGGIVYGVAMLAENQDLTARHVRIDTLQELQKLQGSKYVQSDIGMTYRQVKKDLQDGKQILFSGTPCQIAGLVSCLGRRYENLLTVEVVCHGVPNGQMFQSFLNELEVANKASVLAFAFRTKKKGQGKTACVAYLRDDGSEIRTYRDGSMYSYLYFFQKSLICRSSCYACPFAAAERVADITLGDYWGFHEEHPILPSKVKLSNAKGVSCVLINTEKGIMYFEKCMPLLIAIETTFEKIAKHNEQLRKPCTYRKERDVIMELYRTQGYSAVEEYFQKTCRKDRMVSMVVDFVPKGIRRAAKRIIGMLK